MYHIINLTPLLVRQPPNQHFSIQFFSITISKAVSLVDIKYGSVEVLIMYYVTITHAVEVIMLNKWTRAMNVLAHLAVVSTLNSTESVTVGGHC